MLGAYILTSKSLPGFGSLLNNEGETKVSRPRLQDIVVLPEMVCLLKLGFWRDPSQDGLARGAHLI